MTINGIEIEVQRKSVKCITLRVLPPDGSVRLVLPWCVGDSAARDFVEKKQDWIRRTQERIQRQAQERKNISGEEIYLLGRPYRLRIETNMLANMVRLDNDEVVMQCKPGSTPAMLERIMECFYKRYLASILDGLLPKWQAAMQEEPISYSIRTMRTAWGSCSPRRRTIRFNMLLVKKPLEQIEYVVVHELAHLKEANHSAAFWQIVGHYIPNYKELRNQLNH